MSRPASKTEQARPTLRDTGWSRLGYFAKGLVHRFNNILSEALVIIELVELRDELAADDRAAVRRLRSLLRQLASMLTLSANFFRQPAPKLGVLRLSDVLAQLQEHLTHKLPSSLSLTVSSAAEDATFAGHLPSLLQVMDVLADNVIDCLDGPGEVHLSAAVTRDDAENPRVVISLTDSGPGLTEVGCERVFEPFFSTRQRPDRPGFGLYRARELTGLLGGCIRLRLVEGGGASFELSFPARPSAVLAEAGEGA